jgi:hypothetical protein
MTIQAVRDFNLEEFRKSYKDVTKYIDDILVYKKWLKENILAPSEGEVSGVFQRAVLQAADVCFVKGEHRYMWMELLRVIWHLPGGNVVQECPPCNPRPPELSFQYLVSLNISLKNGVRAAVSQVV